MGLVSQISTAHPPEARAGTEVIAYILADLAIILIAARIVRSLVVKLKQPRVVGDIIESSPGIEEFDLEARGATLAEA